MEIAVLGGGHGCYAAAGDLSEAGRAVRFWRHDASAFAPILEAKTIKEKGSEPLMDNRLWTTGNA